MFGRCDIMQILKGTKREITLLEWNEVLAKAEKSLAESKKNVMSFMKTMTVNNGLKKILQK